MMLVYARAQHSIGKISCSKSFSLVRILYYYKVSIERSEKREKRKLRVVSNSGAPWVRKSGYQCTQEISVLTKSSLGMYVHPFIYADEILHFKHAAGMFWR